MVCYGITFVVSLALMAGVDSHRPLARGPTCAPQFTHPTDALLVPDISISWSVRRIHTCQGPESRAFWLKWKNTDPARPTYVGCGVPTIDRFQFLRVDYLVMGPGLPALTADEEAVVPAGVLKQFNEMKGASGKDWGGILERSPADQSTCDHLKSSLVDHCSVRHNRCDFHEPFGDSHSWRVVDRDHMKMPVKGEMYYVGTWLQQNSTGKYGVAIGTWKEDFATDYGSGPQLDTCSADAGDFDEKETMSGDDPVPWEACSGEGKMENPGTPWSGPKECGSCGSWSCKGPCKETSDDNSYGRRRRSTTTASPGAKPNGEASGAESLRARYAVTAAAVMVGSMVYAGL